MPTPVRVDHYRQPVVVVVCDYYLPGFKAGGPVVSISAIARLLKGYARILILTRDRDYGDTERYPDIKIDQINGENSYGIYYFNSRIKLFNFVRSVEADVIYFNSFFSAFSLIALLASLLLPKDVKRLLAPRGELGRGALNIRYKRKRVFLKLFHLFGLHRMIIFHATSASEAEDIRRELHVESTVVMNVPAIPAGRMQPCPKKRGKGRFIYLSRVTRKKNLVLALKALHNMKGAEVEFDIYGPVEDDAYWRECMHVIETLPNNVRVEYCGSLNPAEVSSIWGGYHALLLPTANENFGHAIIEALQHGVLPVISDQTPWRNLEAANVGWDVELDDPAYLIHAIKQVVDLDNETFQRMSKNATSYAAKICDVESIKIDYFRLFGIKDAVLPREIDHACD